MTNLEKEKPNGRFVPGKSTVREKGEASLSPRAAHERKTTKGKVHQQRWCTQHEQSSEVASDVWGTDGGASDRALSASTTPAAMANVPPPSLAPPLPFRTPSSAILKMGSGGRALHDGSGDKENRLW